MSGRLKPNAGPSPRYCGVCGGRISCVECGMPLPANAVSHSCEPRRLLLTTRLGNVYDGPNSITCIRRRLLAADPQQEEER